MWKVYNEMGDGLHHLYDADQFGDFITAKHKGPVGRFIPWRLLAYEVGS